MERIFAGMPQKELEFLGPLIRNAAFMMVTLGELQTQIAEAGAVEEYQNGAAQKGQKVSAALQAYNQTMKVYLGTMRELVQRLPQEQQESALAALLSGGDVE